MLESTEKGEVRKTVGNYRLILMNDPNLQGAFRLNMFTDKIDITRDLGWYRESDSLTDVDLKFLVVYLEKHYGLSNEKRIEDVIKVVANENRYHPVLDRINSITWDGWERIRYALHLVCKKENDEPFANVTAYFQGVDGWQAYELNSIDRIVYLDIVKDGVVVDGTSGYMKFDGTTFTITDLDKDTFGADEFHYVITDKEFSPD